MLKRSDNDRYLVEKVKKATRNLRYFRCENSERERNYTVWKRNYEVKRDKMRVKTEMRVVSFEEKLRERTDCF